MKKYFLVIFFTVAIFSLAVLFLPIFENMTMHALAIRALNRTRYALMPIGKADVFLPVKFDKQDHALSCEAAALKMLLTYKNISVDESEIIKKIGVDPTPKFSKSGKLIWGDPQKGFVGNIDGKMLVDGYGVYWEPIARVANDYHKAGFFENWTVADLVHELKNDNPVIVWIYLGSGKPTSWQTPENKLVRAVFYEHTFVINGFKGRADNPEGFFAIDPIYGQIYLSKSNLLKKWSTFNSSGVIVY